MTDEKLDPANFKLIRTTGGTVRVSQACDRCRIKKIKCDGLTPCHNCAKIDFECKTSDKLTRRAFPKGYTENLEKKLKELEEENRILKEKYEDENGEAKVPGVKTNTENHIVQHHHNDLIQQPPTPRVEANKHDKVTLTNSTNVQINNPIDQIFNLDGKGIIIGNDNLNFESQFNHLLINLNLPFLKITNSHNFLLNDPNSYLYHPSYTKYNRFHNRDLDVIYNPLTANNSQHDDLLGEMVTLANNQLPIDIYDFFIKLINNFKKIFSTKKELDNQIIHFFLNYNIFIPIFDYKLFMESYDAFHTMYPFMFTYDDATINGFNILNNDYHVVNEYLMVVVQIYAMIMMNDPTINLNLLLNHSEPSYINDNKRSSSVVRSLYDFLPYFNVFHVSVAQLQTYLLFLHYSLITNNKEKSLVLSSLINSFIGILGINLNSKNLFFNDLTLTTNQRRTRVKIFWCFKILLKVFNLKFGFKPSLNTTVINPVTIDRYFELTPAKLSTLLEEGEKDELFKILLKPSIEFLNLVNIIIPSSFSPNYYQYLKGDNDGKDHQQPGQHHPPKSKKARLDWILNDDDGDGSDGNLNYNFNQFLTIDKNLTSWRESLKEKELNLIPLQMQMNLPVISGISKNNLYHSIPRKENDTDDENSSTEIPSILSPEAIQCYLTRGLPDRYTASQLIKIQLNFHYLLIRSMNYLNFVIDKELTSSYFVKLTDISREVLSYFIAIFQHVSESKKYVDSSKTLVKLSIVAPHNAVMESLGLDVDEDGFVINDFLVKRRRVSQPLHQGGPGGGGKPSSQPSNSNSKRLVSELPKSPFNHILNGLSMTIINLKKSIILQMLYLLISSLKIFKKGEERVSRDTRNILNNSVDLFIKIFINYNPDIKKEKSKFSMKTTNQGSPSLLSNSLSKEAKLFGRLINDELKDEILKEPRRSGTEDSDDNGSEDDIDDEENEISQIDWDDEEMDEDLKYLKILKFLKYKINSIYNLSKVKHMSGKFKKNVNNTNSNNTNYNNNKKENTVNPIPTRMSQGGNPGMSALMLQQSPLHLYSGGPSPPNYTSSGNLSKVSSLSKFDFLLGEDNYPVHTLGSTGIGTPSSGTGSYPIISKLKEYNGGNASPPSAEDLELIKKERIAINDLMSLKNQKGENSPVFHSNWNMEEERK